MLAAGEIEVIRTEDDGAPTSAGVLAACRVVIGAVFTATSPDVATLGCCTGGN